MSTIFLYVKNEGWKSFEYGSDECNKVLIDIGVTIGSDVTIISGVRIGSCVRIDSDVTISSGVTICSGVTIGSDVTIDSGVRIDSGVTISSGVTIGSGVTIDSGVTICSGVIKSLFITGSSHYVIWYGTGILHIGCHKKEIEWWVKNYELIGKKQNYSDAQIKEYYGYIVICKQMQDSL